MFNYLPERIYNKVKDDKRYKHIDLMINSSKLKCQTLYSMIMFDANVKDSELFKELFPQYEQLIKELAPAELGLFNMINNVYSYEDLKDYANKINYPELKLFALSYVIHGSFVVREHLENMTKYAEYYETLDKATLSNMSKYVHYAYLIYSTFANVSKCPVDDIFDVHLPKLAKTKDSLMKYTDTDILNHYYLIALSNLVNIGTSRTANDKKVLRQLEFYDVFSIVTNLEFQYTKHSYFVLHIIDSLMGLYLSARNHQKVLELIKFVVDYINNIYAGNMNYLNKGLSFYDKEMHMHFGILLFKYYEIVNNLLPKGTFEFKNIPQEDIDMLEGLERLVLSKASGVFEIPTFNISGANKETVNICERYFLTTSSWLENAKYSFKMVDWSKYKNV